MLGNNLIAAFIRIYTTLVRLMIIILHVDFFHLRLFKKQFQVYNKIKGKEQRFHV